MAKTDPLDPSVPAGTEDPKLGDNRIRALARAVAEILNVDHYMGTDGGAGTGYNEDAAGEHKKIKFNAPISTPTNVSNKLFVYGKDVGGKIELHCLDEDGNEIQLTSAGKLYSASGFAMPSGQTAIIETVQAVDETGIVLKNDGDDTVITVGDDGTATLADGSQLASSAEPTADADIANKKYVDDNVGAANWSPTSYSNEQSITMPNGFIMKVGSNTVANGATVNFDTAFPSNVKVSFANAKGYAGGYSANSSASKTGITIYHNIGGSIAVDWIAIGY